MLFVLFISAVICFSASAHQDRIIKLENGVLVGLPDKYQPAYFNLQKKSLQIGVNQLDFPPCISNYFSEDAQDDILITSSWHHDLTTIPPYLLISIQPQERYYSYKLLFDMDTLKPYDFQIDIRRTQTFTSHQSLVIDDNCHKSIEESLRQIN